MTLDEYINLCGRRIEELYKAIPCEGCAFQKCKEENEQLLELLKELKEYRKFYSCRNCYNASASFNDYPCCECRRCFKVLDGIKDHYEGVNTDAT